MSSTNFQALLSSFRGFDKGSDINYKTVGLLVATLVCTLMPLELSQLAFALIGALAYALLQAFNPSPAKTNCQITAEREYVHRERGMRMSPQRQPPRKTGSPWKATNPRAWPCTRVDTRSAEAPEARVAKPEVYQPSSVPVCAPKFASSGWEGEVSELVSQLEPGASDDQAIQRLVAHVQQTITAIFPEVVVSGFAHGNLNAGKAFGVAVPEVDIVANISPASLLQRMQQRTPKVDVKKLQKSAVRMCTDRLVAQGGLKFRRSAFRGEEPRVTLLVPSSLGIFKDAIPVDFSINSVTPFYTAALLTECGQIEPRAKALILLVKRWAKDRGICHAAKGHLSPYMWSLLAMYFMQVGVDDEGPLLPTLDCFKISSESSVKRNVRRNSLPPGLDAPEKPSTSDMVKLSIGQLFDKFLHFYTQRFNWTGEAISIRAGRRAPPSLDVPLHVVLDQDGTSRIAPAIEDPFNAGVNLGTIMNPVSLARLHEELSRGSEMCTRGASLSELLQPWVPVQDVPQPTSSPRSSGSSPGDSEEPTSRTMSASSSA